MQHNLKMNSRHFVLRLKDSIKIDQEETFFCVCYLLFGYIRVVKLTWIYLWTLHWYFKDFIVNCNFVHCQAGIWRANCYKFMMSHTYKKFQPFHPQGTVFKFGTQNLYVINTIRGEKKMAPFFREKMAFLVPINPLNASEDCFCQRSEHTPSVHSSSEVILLVGYFIE